jgi:hypothetical protein
VKLLNRLPEAGTVANGGHLSLEVRGRRFGWLLDDHHGDRRLALTCRAPDGASRVLVSTAPKRFYIPKYLGHRVCVGIWLDLDEIDWSAVEEMLADAYRMTAPRILVRRFWESG